MFISELSSDIPPFWDYMRTYFGYTPLWLNLYYGICFETQIV